MKTFLQKFAWWSVYSLAIVVILAATLVSAGRMLTPYLNEHRHDFEVWASAELQVPVSIEQIHITWYYYEPVLTFEKVAVLERTTHKPNFKIQQIKVNLEVLPSLLHWRPIPQYIKIFGASLTLREQAAGKMSVEGNTTQFMVIDNITGSTIGANSLVTWVLSQPRLVLENIDLKYIPLHDTEKLINIDKVSLANTKSTHELSGNALLNQDIPLTIKFNLQVTGDVTNIQALNIHAYFYLEGVFLPQWLKQKTWQHFQIDQGLGSAKIWVDWQQNQLQKIDTELQVYDLEIKSLLTKKILSVSRMSGRLGWKRDNNNQIIYGENILLDFPQHLWPTTGFALTIAPTVNGSPTIQSLRIDYLDIADSIELAKASGFMPEQLDKIFTQLELDGNLNALNIKFNGSNAHLDSIADLLNNSLSVEFSHLTCNAWKQLPSVNNVTGLFSWDGQRGNLKVNSQKTSFDITAMFTHPLLFDQINGDFNFQKNTQGEWSITGKDIAVINEDLSANTDFSLLVPQKDSPVLDLTADFSMTNMTRIVKYMPLKILEPKLSHWLQNTFYGGQISAGKVIVKGRLADIPFDKNNGKLLVSADVKDLDFEYAPKWPGIKHLNGNIVFSGHVMTADVDSGQMLNIPLQHVHAEIPYIGHDQPQILNLHSIITTDFMQALQYVQNSPLQKTLGNQLSAMQLTGLMQLNLALSIPLKVPEKTVVSGDMTFPKAELKLPDWNIGLSDVNGSLHFTDHDINATNIQAVLFHQPIHVNIGSTLDKNEKATVIVKFNSQMTTAVLKSLLKMPDLTFLQGAMTYNVQLNLTADEQKPSQFIITSDLKGLTVNLPEIYGKKAPEIRPFELDVNMGASDSGLQIKVLYGNLLSVAATLQNKTFYSGELHFGALGSATWQTKPGLLISGQFDQWDLTTWQRYWSELSQGHHKTSSLNMDFLRGIDLSAKQFSALGLNLHNAHIQAQQDKKIWSIRLSSQEMTGQIKVPNDFKQTIQANFQHLYLTPVTGTSSIDPRSLPAILFVSDDLRYQNMNFGHVSFHLMPMRSGLMIQSLQASSNDYHLSAQGEWLHTTENNSKTHLQGDLDTKDVNKLLDAWGVNASNLVGSGGAVQFNLNWNGAPYSPVMTSLTGGIGLNLTAGRIIDLSGSTDAKMGIGKILNLFNLSSIPRRLSLNFSDLFQKGYSFDSMKGELNLKNGSAFITKDITFDGPIARIEIAGRIGFVAKDYDMHVSVTPYGMTSSLPLVATMVGGPVAGAATWLVDKVVGGAVSSVTTHHYTVRGPWSHPEWGEGNS